MSEAQAQERLRVLWRSRQGSDEARGAAEHPLVEIRIAGDDQGAAALRDWAQVLVSGSVDGELLDGSDLRHVVVPRAGVRPELAAALRERPHLTLSNSHFNDASVAQHAVALLLAAANRIVEPDRALRQGDWRHKDDASFRSLPLAGANALLLGYGAIGRRVAGALRALGARISVYRSSAGEPDEGVEREFGPGGLLEALRGSDVVVSSLPSTAQTRGLLGAEEFAALPRGAVLVNVGHGDVIDQWALYRALRSGRLRAAGLDVWWDYPERPGEKRLPAEAPLHELPNLVMSPHRADMVDGWEEDCFRDVLKTLEELASGGVRNRVDVERGY